MIDSNKNKIDTRKKKIVRRVIQFLFFGFVFLISFFKYISSKGISLPFEVSGFHGICPFGAVAAFGRYITQGKFIPETQPSNFWIFFGIVLLTVLFGKIFCGWFCPLGSVQDLFYYFGRKIKKLIPALNKNQRNTVKSGKTIFIILSRILSYAKYFILILVILQTTKKINLVFAKIDPFYALFNFYTGDVLLSALIVLGFVLLLSLFIYRPWCRWFCPLGALLGIIQKISLWSIRRDTETCINCNLCSKKCPVNINVSEKISITDTSCIRCSECLSVCPVPGALEHRLPVKYKKISEEKNQSENHRIKSGFPLYKNLFTPVLFLIIFFIPVIYGKYFTDSYYGNHDKSIPAVYSDSGSVSSVLIKSSMTLKGLADQYGTSHGELKKYLGISDGVADETKLRDIEDVQSDITLKYIKGKMGEFTQ